MTFFSIKHIHKKKGGKLRPKKSLERKYFSQKILLVTVVENFIINAIVNFTDGTLFSSIVYYQ